MSNPQLLMIEDDARLAQMVSDLVGVHQSLQERVDVLEKAVPAMQEAILNLQLRVNSLEAPQ